MSEHSPLRIAWATPWNIHSSTTMFSRCIVEELTNRGHTVHVIRTEFGEALGLEPLPMPEGVLPPRAAAAVPNNELRLGYDAIVTNIGDNFPFYGAVFYLVGVAPFLSIIHDTVLTRLFSGFGIHAGATRAAALLTAARDAGLVRQASEDPLPEWFAGHSIAMVTHARHCVGRLRNACPGPVVTLPLACPDSGNPPRRTLDGWFNVATIGCVNPNERVDTIVEAIGISPELRRRCRYKVIGAVEEAERVRLEALAAEWELNPIELTGWVAKDELERLIGETDAICCLRHPVLEGGSGSLLAALLAARPVLVSNQGVYSELPDNIVMKCAPGRETIDVARNLEFLVANPEIGRAIGERARAYVLQTHTSEKYVNALLPLILHAAPAGPAIATGLAIGRTLAKLGVKASDPALSRIAAEYCLMLKGEGRRE
jgi:glycosyltransferase involved in cell wall biosynthesis